MTDLPFMKLYWPEFLADTAHLGADELGLYVRVLGQMWLSSDGHISQERLRRLSHQASLKPGFSETDSEHLWMANADAVREMLKSDKNGRFTQKRLLEEHKNARETRAKLSEAGKKGGLSQAKASLKPGLAVRSKSINKPPIVPLTNGTKKPKTNGALVDLNGWTPDEQDRAYARDRGLEPGRILEDIRDWAANAEPSRTKKRDPRRFWQGWCRREADKRGGPPETLPSTDRRLTFEEQRSYEVEFKPVPRTTSKPAGEWGGLGERPN